MRNLKKILSLALALVMVMSLLTVVGARDFNDADQIEHTEAVEVMSALGVINGRGNNTFDPKGNVTRGEMAKMITYISLGNVEPTAFLGTTTNLTDINGHWAEAYIKYCYSQGIISGRGNGIFDPNASVTATEAARMLLVAIGYNADVQIYTGSSWAINVVRDAQLSHLYDDVSVTSDEVLNRDKAAQMMYNALLTKTIEKSSSVDRVTGDITDIYTANGRPLLWKSYRAKVAVATFLGNDSYATSGSPLKGEISIAAGSIEDDDRTGAPGFSATTFPYDFDIDNIGEQVKVIFKDGTTGTPYTPDKNDTIYGVYKTNATNVVRAIKGDVKDQKDDNGKIKIGSTKYDVSAMVNVVTDYINTPGSTSSALTGSSPSYGNSALTTLLKEAKGDAFKMVDTDDDGKFDTIFVTTCKIAAVTAVNSEKVTLNSSVGNINFEGNDIYSGIARGDVVTVTTLYNASASNDAAYSIVKPAEVVSGTVNGYDGTKSINLSGTSYKIYDEGSMLGTIPDKTPRTTLIDTDIGDEFDLYLVNGYVGAAVVTAANANNYSMVINIGGINAGDTFNALQLQVLSSDGTKKVITVSDKSASGQKAASNYAIGDVITYTGSDSNANVTTKARWSSASSQVYTDTTKTVSGLVVSDDCVLFTQTSGTNALGGTTPGNAKFEAFKLRTLKTTASVPMIYVTNQAGNRIVAVVAQLGGRPSGSAGSTVYGMITKAHGNVGVGENNDVYEQYTVTSGGQDYTVYLPTGTGLLERTFVYFDPVSDNIYGTGDVKQIGLSGSSNNPGVISGTTAVTGGFTSELVVDGSDRSLSFYTDVETEPGTTSHRGKGLPTTWALAKDCQIVYVDKDGKKAGADYGDNVPEFNPTTDEPNAIIVYDNTTYEIISIIVNTDGKNAPVMNVDTTIADAAVTATIEDTMRQGGTYTHTGPFNFTTNSVVAPATGTLEVKGAVTGTVAQVSRPTPAPTAASTAEAAQAVTAPAPAVTFTGGNVENFGNTTGKLPGTTGSSALAIFAIDLSNIPGLTTDSVVTVTAPGSATATSGKVDSVTDADGNYKPIFNFLVGDKTVGDVVLQAGGKYVKVHFDGWTPTPTPAP